MAAPGEDLLVPGPSSVTVVLIDRVGDDGLADDWRESVAAEPVEVVVVDPTAPWVAEVPQQRGLADDDLVVVADLPSVPGPDLLPRLLAARAEAGGMTIVDARVLPVEWSRVAERSLAHRESGDNPAPVNREEARPTAETVSPRVSGACTLLDVAALRQLAATWAAPADRGAELQRLASQTGRSVVVASTASVFMAVRVDAHGRPSGWLSRSELEDDPAFTPPTDLHPAALPATSLSAVLSLAGATASRDTDNDQGVERPFLSVVTRTQGNRLLCLEEMFTCLAGQTVRDFEVLLVRHRVTGGAAAMVDEVVATLPGWLRDRVRVVDVERPGRAAPLNDGFEAAHGRYIAILDDDDTVLGHWVESFLALERRAAGRLLRAATVRQDVVPLTQRDALVPVSVGDTFATWPATFELVDHLCSNYSPCMSMAFPRGAFHHLGLRFDEALDTTEDWDFLVRVAGVVGAESTEEVTSVYRWWLSTASSREAHDTTVWDEARRQVLAKIDDSVIVLAPGSARRFREAIAEGWERSNEIGAIHEQLVGVHRDSMAIHEQLVGVHRDTVAAHEDLVGVHRDTVAAHDYVAELWQAAQKQVVDTRAKVVKLREEFAWRKAQSDEHLALVREADRVLRKGSNYQQLGTVLDLSVAELRAVISETAHPEGTTKRHGEHRLGDPEGHDRHEHQHDQA